jgi:lipoate-protein ligase A
LLKIYHSLSRNPYFNLAFESYLVEQHRSGEAYLYLWQNENTVVIGRNQNPWKECDLTYLEETGGKLARRMSGGGAVYHDLGNLNFTFVTDDGEEQIHQNIAVIIAALGAEFGIRAEFSGKNDLMVDGFKVSGNAYFAEEGTLCHHGTLLVDVDGNRLGKLLTVSKQKLESKGIDSVRSRVKNLVMFNPNVTVEGLMRCLDHAFITAYGTADHAADYKADSTTVRTIDVIDVSEGDVDTHSSAVIHPLMQQFESWEWRYGASPAFNVQMSERYAWGSVDLYLMVEDGIVKAVKIASDALDVNLPEKLSARIVGAPFDEAKIKALMA